MKGTDERAVVIRRQLRDLLVVGNAGAPFSSWMRNDGRERQREKKRENREKDIPFKSSARNYECIARAGHLELTFSGRHSNARTCSQPPVNERSR